MSPENSPEASLIATSLPNHGGMWVSTSRPTLIRLATDPQSAPVRCRWGGLSSRGPEGRLGDQQRYVGSDLVQPVARTGVAAVAEGGTVGADPQPVGQHRVVDLDRLHRERAEVELAVVLREVEVLAHARVERQAVGVGHPVGDPRRPPDRDRPLRPLRAVAAQHVVAAHVDVVVGVQVADQYAVDAQRVDVVVQRAERAVAELEQHPPGAAVGVVGLEQVAGGRRVGAGIGTRAADHGDPHVRPPANWVAATISGPRNRRPMVSNSVGAPVVTKVYVGSPPSRIRPVSASIL